MNYFRAAVTMQFRMVERTFCHPMLNTDEPRYNLRLVLCYYSLTCGLDVINRKPDDSAC